MSRGKTNRGGDENNKNHNLRNALKESEGRLQCVVQLAVDYYWEQDREHRYTLLQARDRNLPENDERHFLGKTSWERGGIPLEGSWEDHLKLREQHLPFHDFVIMSSNPRDGERYLSLSGEPRFDDQGAFLGYRGITREVTREKRYERMLRLERSVSRILLDSSNALQAIRDAIRAICLSERWEAGQYWRLDSEDNVMRYYEGWCIADPVVEQVARENRELVIPPWFGLVGEVWRSGEPLWVADLATDPRLRRKSIVQRTGWKNSLLFPVRAEGRIIGVLNFNAPYIPEPDERLLQLIQVLGAQLGNYSQRAIALEQLRESEERYQSTVELAAIGISHVDGEGRFLHVNRQLCDMLGYTREELLRLNVKDISHPDDQDVTDPGREQLRAGDIPSFKVEKRYLRKDGTPIWVCLTVAKKWGADGQPLYDISVVEDISARKAAEERVRYLANHDEMTDLPNRQMFNRLLDHGIKAARRYQRHLALLFIDLDCFKEINDSLGHQAGDRLLKALAARMKASLRASDVLARLGGDEFVALVQEVGEPDQAGVVARNLLAAAIEPITIKGRQCQVSASIGICMFPQGGEDGESLMRNADLAMYRAKEAGRNTFCFHGQEAVPEAESCDD